MTKEEHIIYLKNLRTALKLANNFSGETMESLNKAIEALEAKSCGDAISRDELLKNQTVIVDDDGLAHKVVHIGRICAAPSVNPEQKSWKPMNNNQWIDFLARAWDISRTSAKDMLHVMMSVKREDNFKKQFSGRKRGREMSWGISENASEMEKLKAEINDYFRGLNAVGKIDYRAYCELYDVCMPIIEKCYSRIEEERKAEREVKE